MLPYAAGEKRGSLLAPGAGTPTRVGAIAAVRERAAPMLARLPGATRVSPTLELMSSDRGEACSVSSGVAVPCGRVLALLRGGAAGGGGGATTLGFVEAASGEAVGGEELPVGQYGAVREVQFSSGGASVLVVFEAARRVMLWRAPGAAR